MKPQFQLQSQSQSTLKMQKHTINIRRNARNKIIQNKRNQIYFQTQPIQKIVEIFGLPPKSDTQYSVVEIIKNCFNMLLGVVDKIGGMSQQGRSSIEIHVWFWAYLVQEFYTERLVINQFLSEFFIQFIHHLPYKVLSNQPLLQLKIINALQLSLVSQQASQKLRISCLKWVQGTDSLTLIHNSLTNQFLCPHQYQNIYKILIQSLKLQSYQKLCQVCQIIKCIMKAADYDDTYRIYSEVGELMVYLNSTINRFVDSYDLSSQVDAIIYLLDSYNSLVFDYARMGVGLLAVQLIGSNIEGNIVKGLEIIKFVSEVEEIGIIVFLLEDRELSQAGLWGMIFGRQFLPKNQNISIKKQTANILANIMSNGDSRTLAKLNRLSLTYNHRQIIDILCQSLKKQEDVIILRQILTMLSILLYYSQNYQPDSEEQQPHNHNHNHNHNPDLKNNMHFYYDIMGKMIELQVEKDIKKLQSHRSLELAQSANKLYASFQFVLRQQKSI